MRFTKQQAEVFEKKLLKKGYRKYREKYHNEDYVYWKNIRENSSDNDPKYSIGFGFYDWSVYPQYTDPEEISVSFNFLLGNDLGVGRMDINISDNFITIEQFEKFCEEFYQFFINQKTIGKCESKTLK